MTTTKLVDGIELLNTARKHVGERYVLGVLVPKNNPRWIGPWDCAEFVSWVVYQTSQTLYGCSKDSNGPVSADAYTGFWAADANSKGNRISVQEAAQTAGAAVLRVPKAGAIGHVVISDGKGGTVEAHSSKYGVIESTLSNRRWDMGILVPGIKYRISTNDVDINGPLTTIYRLRKPYMTGSKVRELQRALKNAGINSGGLDGVFGPMTQAAVSAFQISKGLVADGEVGPITAKALGISL